MAMGEAIREVWMVGRVADMAFPAARGAVVSALLNMMRVSIWCSCVLVRVDQFLIRVVVVGRWLMCFEQVVVI